MSTSSSRDKKSSSRSSSKRKRRSYSRSRSRSYSRSRSRSRSPRERRSYHHKKRQNWREHDDRDEEDYDKREEKSYQTAEPSSILMLRNLVLSITKEQLTKSLGTAMSTIKDVRLIQNREGSKNYAFVEFCSTEDAVRWMSVHESNFEVRGCQVNVTYSRQKEERKRKENPKWSDWNCFKCGTLNFSKRTVCLTCDCPRSESDSLFESSKRAGGNTQESDTNEDRSGPPTNVIIFRGLDNLSTEVSIRQSIADISSVYVKDVRLIKDKLTNISRGFCFVETTTPEEAGELMKAIQEQHPAFFVDGKRVNASYARQNTGINKPCTNAKAAAAIEQAQAMVNQQRQLKQQQAKLQTQYTSCYDATSNIQTPTPPTNTSTNDSEAAQQQANTELPSTYLFDSTSGFYYDTTTGLYYDPNTQYHYNSQTGQYCYYDSTKQAYIAVNTDGTPVTDDPNANKEKKKKDVTTLSGSKTAKKIAKDMERWAKSINVQRQVQQQLIQQMAEREKLVSDIEQSNETNAEQVDQTPAPEEAAVTDNSSKSNDGSSDHIDWQQLACLLCKRKFTSIIQLKKHQQMSELHKQNIEKLKQKESSTTTPQQPLSFELQYRDRAKERRDKFGTDAIVPGWKKRFERERAKEIAETTSFEEPQHSNETGATENIGSKLLKAMGWNEGEGLGRTNQGITKPIEAEQRQLATGLGAPNSSPYPISSNYRENVRSMARYRFKQMYENNNK